MKIDSIKLYHAGSNDRLKQKQKNNALEYSESMGVDYSEKVNRGYYSGSFTGNGAAVKFLDRCLDKANLLCDKHTVIAQNLVALILAGTFRPAAIMALPSEKKNKKDKIYAAVQGISSAVVGFGFSTLVMYPLGQAVKKFKASVKAVNGDDLGRLSAKTVQKLKDIYKVENLKDLPHSKAFKNTTKILDMAPDVFIFGVAKACLTIAMIPPILKFFGVEKSKKPQTSVDTKPEVPPMNKAKQMAKSFFAPDLASYDNAKKIHELEHKIEALEETSKPEGGQK